MLAFGLCLALFSYFLLLGTAVVRPLIASQSRTQSLLLAPVVGYVVNVLVVFLLNRLGLPVAKFGPALAIALMLAASLAHWQHYRKLPPERFSPETMGRNARPMSWLAKYLYRNPPSLQYLPFLLIIIAGGVLTGRPMFSWGFDWLSFCNDDMANYCLSADRFLHFKFDQPPLTQELLAGKDWSQPFWWLHIPMMVRAGSELSLAWVCSITTLNAHQAYMPTIVAFHMMLISATAGLVYQNEKLRTAGLFTALLTAGSAQLTFGTVYQLIAQAVGLALLCTNLSLLCRSFDLSRGQLLRHGLLTGICLSGQLVTYPEVNPFLGGGFIVFILAEIVRRRLSYRGFGWMMLAGTIGPAILLNTYLYDALAFMIGQRTQAQSGGDVSTTLFPFFLVPAGLSNYWGFTSLASMPETNRFWIIAFNISIAVGGLLLLAALISAIRLTWRGDAIGGVCMVCLLLAIYLFKIDAGFGLYKLAMFSQPFVLGTLAVAWTRLAGKRWWLSPLILLLLIPSIRIQARYVAYSQDQGTTFSEVRGATRTRIVQEFRDTVVKAAWNESKNRGGTPPVLICDPYNVSLSKLMALHTRGISSSLPASPFFQRSMRPAELPDLALPHIRKMALEYVDAVGTAVRPEKFEFRPQEPGKDAAEFWYISAGGRAPGEPTDPADAWVIATTPRTNLLNRRRMIEREERDGRLQISYPPENFRVIPLAKAQNFLLATASDKSQPYFNAGDPAYIAIYQIENDPQYFTRDSMAGVGPYLLFEVLNPQQSFRLCMELSATMKADRENQLPPAVAVGATRQPFPIAGRGSARVFSPPIAPQKIGGRWFVGIDMGRLGVTFPSERPYLQGLYGKRVSLDRRRLVGFARDISTVTEDEYRQLKPPTEIVNWASGISDLRHPDLEYTGFYEDGWMAESAYMVLRQPTPTSRLKIRGMAPGGVGFEGFTTKLTLLIDGREVPFSYRQAEKNYTSDKPIASGFFDIELPLPPGGDKRKIELRSSQVRNLGAPDNRPAAIQFSFIGLVKG